MQKIPLKTKFLQVVVAATVIIPLASASAQDRRTARGGHAALQQFGSQFGLSLSRNYAPPRCDHHGDYRHYDSRDHRSRSARHHCGNDRIRLIGGYQRGKGTRPKGWHDKSWFRKRGYNLDNYVHVHEKSGIVHYGAHVGGRGHSSHRDSHDERRYDERRYDQRYFSRYDRYDEGHRGHRR